MANRRAAIAALALVLTCPVWLGSEEVTWPTSNEAGLTQPDLSAVLYQDSAPVAIPGGVAVVAHPNGRDYTWTGLPDVAAGIGTTYELTWDTPGGSVYQYRWPHETRTPQAVIWTSTFQVAIDPLQVGINDTLPTIQIDVLGLAADPTGAIATFSMRKPSFANKITNAPATIVAIAFDVVTGTWTATAEYQWVAGDTDTNGLYDSWFTVNFVTGGIMTWPPDRSLNVEIVP